MTAPQQEEAVLDAAVLAELAHISSKLYPDLPTSNALLENYKNQLERVCGCIHMDQHSYLLDLLMVLIEGLDKLTEENRSLSIAEQTLLQKIPGILSEYLILPAGNQADKHLLELMKDPQWIRPLSVDEEKELIALIDSEDNNINNNDCIELDDLLSNIIEDESPDAITSGIDRPAQNVDHTEQRQTPRQETPVIPDINENLQELVDLIKAELSEVTEITQNLQYELNKGDHEQTVNMLQNMSDQADNISNAVKLLGLEGLYNCGKFLSHNINLLASSADNLTNTQIELLMQWPVKCLAYLEQIHDINTIVELLALIGNESWPEVLSKTEIAHYKKLLENPEFLEEEAEQRQSRATADDVDLTLPDDVNQELLDALLLDLPSQTEEFSTAIQNISAGGGLENIDIAQRIAHTLKGAANVVGVTGIANLTHHLEDILQSQAKTGMLPQEPLISLLVRASDCLESMAEALLGIDTPPGDAVNVLQEVLDWANKLDHEIVPGKNSVSVNRDQAEIPCIQTVNPDDLAQKPDSESDKQQSQKNAATDNLLRIPASLADEMLRLAGENLIYTSQIQEYINVLNHKQDAIDLHNHSLQQLSYDLEHLIDIQGYMPGSDNTHTDHVFDPLEMDEYHEIHTISRRLIEIAADSVQLSHELENDLSGLKELVLNQNQLHKESEELVLRTRMVPIKTIIPRLKRGVRQASRITGKKVELLVNDNNTFMDSEVLTNLIEPIMHILRNAIDHGIEDDEDRLAKGKSPAGTIKLNFWRKGNQILIEISDDGRGLDTDDIYSKAISTGLASPDEDLSIENIQRLILEPGLTTRSKVTQVSGRGIGLDVVSVKIRDLKGSIEISSKTDEGCRFSLSLPISSFSTHSLLVRSRQYIYAISSHGVEEILYPGIGEVRDVGDETIYQIGDEIYSAVLLDTLLHLPPDRRRIVRSTRPILLVKDESGSRTAILVQEVIDSRDVVVKSMGNYIPKLNGIIGATVLGNGSVSPVIDLPELLHENNFLQQNRSEQYLKNIPPMHTRKLPYILVVDDSLSARRSLAQFVQDLGFSVRTARDGMEAVSIIETSKPDMLIVDMEMPKMNGLELTSHVRATPDINNIPVIMVTSRSTDKHRHAAIDKGVNHYMIKPFDEDELAHQINTMLEIA